MDKSLNEMKSEMKNDILLHDIVLKKINDVTIIGKKLYKEKSGIYNYWVVISINKNELLNYLESNYISQDPKLKLDFDKRKFEEEFNDEMAKIIND